MFKTEKGSWCARKRKNNEERVLDEFREADGRTPSDAL